MPRVMIVFITGFLGYQLAAKVVDWVGLAQLVKALPFFVAITFVGLTPLYTLFNKLSEVSKTNLLTSSEKLRLDNLVRSKMHGLIGNALFFVIATAVLLSARFWPQGLDVTKALAGVSGAVLCVTICLFVYVLMDIYEVDRFGDKLEERSKKAEERKRLLAKMAGG